MTKHSFVTVIAAAAFATTFLTGLSGATPSELEELLRQARGSSAGAGASASSNGTVSDAMEVFGTVNEPRVGSLARNARLPADGRDQVMLYVTGTCSPCKKAASHMRKHKIAFVERDVGANPDHKEEFLRLGGRGVPLMVFGRKTVTGYSGEMVNAQFAEFQRNNKNVLTTDRRAADERKPENRNDNRSDPRQNNRGAGNATDPFTVGGADAGAGAGAAVIAARAGDMMASKMDGVRVYRNSDRSGGELMKLKKSDDFVFLGSERDGMLLVNSPKGEGWVDRLLVLPR
jgi:glutaredoxin